MKNLKKVLALVLVFASLLGLATMASATKSDDYSDADSISHVEAVDVMSTIGVFDGISGAFSGSSILTREQAAKIITYMVLGKDDADALVASVAPYTDVARDRWSAGSIAYCKNAGILAGVGNGRFEPNGKLTGVAFAKMCLVALGYDPDIEKLTGSDWAVNTSKLAIASAGITVNLSQSSLADEMSREDACQMAFNTLKADLVDYNDRGMSVTVNNGDGSNIVVSGNPSTATVIKANPSKVDEKRNASNITDEEGTEKTLQFGEKYFTNLKKSGTADSFGRPANVWTYKSEEIGTYRMDSQLRKTWTAKAPRGEVYNEIGSSVANHSYKDTNDTNPWLAVYVDGDLQYSKYVGEDGNKDDSYFKKNSTQAAGVKIIDKNDGDKTLGNFGVSGNGVQTELYMDDEGDVTVVMINTYLVQATSDYSSATGQVSIKPVPDKVGETGSETKQVDISGFMPGEIKSEDFDESSVITSIKEGDYLLVTGSFDGKWGSDEFTLDTVTPATIQKGTVTEYTDTEDVTVGGTKYSYNGILTDSQKNTTFAINSEATLVLDTYGYVMCVDEALASGNFVYIDAFDDGGHFASSIVADAYFTDGTHAEITVSKVYKKGTGSFVKGDLLTKLEDGSYKLSKKKAGWYTFTGSSSSQYTLKELKDSSYTTSYGVPSDLSASDNDFIKSGVTTFLANGDESVKANDKTIFVVKDEEDNVTAYTGVDNVPNVVTKSSGTSSVKIWYVCPKDKIYASYVFIDATNAKVEEVSTTDDYMFVLKETTKTTHVDGFTYLKYKVVIGGKEEERWVRANEDAAAGTLFQNVREDSNGRITGGKEVEDKYVANASDPQQRFVADVYEVKRDSNVLTIKYQKTPDKTFDLMVNSKSNINLVLGKRDGVTNDALTKYGDGESYKTYLNTSASQVESLLKKYSDVVGTASVVKTSKDSQVIETIWIYVTESDGPTD